ncbi:hypothetical protein [Sphingomonas crocodyli]|uniref:Uncharacterized protein n=1 Tax=Sphingomonas crocodyli TaxID=1979270 RepID=A0A437M7Z8_9SPHN|nr:hypothetical protein [Sphingomonas crocodyli]RVT93707.1 hypothetical protein EOD43_07530 [Sphingomonas crocodyli]
MDRSVLAGMAAAATIATSTGFGLAVGADASLIAFIRELGAQNVIAATAVIVAGLALRTTARSNAIARDTARHQLRAYVGIAKATIDPQDEVITFWFKNTGQTLASELYITSRGPRDIEHAASPLGFLQPGQEVHVLNYRGSPQSYDAGYTVRVAFRYHDIYGDICHEWHFAYHVPSGPIKDGSVELVSAGGASYIAHSITSAHLCAKSHAALAAASR